jgi:peptide/nickel transport system substrate-binding protein
MNASAPPRQRLQVGSYQSVLKRVNQIACVVRLALGCALCAIACSGAPETPRGLVIAIESDPQSLDPRFGVDATSARLADLLHVALTRTDPAAGRVPEAAREWEWRDDRTLVFRLRDGLRFADGRPLRASDVRATYEAVHDPALGSPRRGTLASLERVETPDERTVVMHLVAPDAAFPDATGLPILPADRARDRAETTVGAGPYRLVDARRGDRIALAPNPYYAGGRARIDPLVLRVVPDAVVRVLELERGGIGFLEETLEPELLDRLRRSPELQVTTTPGTSVAYLAFNFRDPRLRDRRVRRAIAAAIDADALVGSLLAGTARPATGLLAPEHWAYAPTARVRHSRRLARRLLDRAGLVDPDGDGPEMRFRIVYKTSNQPSRRRLAEALQADLARVGVALDVRTYEWGTLFADVRSGNFEMAAMAWVGVADPDLYRLAYHSAMEPPAGMNRGRYANRSMDRLTDAGRRTRDPAARRAIYAAVQRLAAHDLPALPLWWEDRVVVSTRRLHGFAPSPSGDLVGLASAVVE